LSSHTKWSNISYKQVINLAFLRAYQIQSTFYVNDCAYLDAMSNIKIRENRRRNQELTIQHNTGS